jgi:ParB family chromosome partitioning protein
VVQPIVVRPLAGGLYEIIAGERRWRASKLAGLTSIPAVIRQLDDQSALAIALIENIQREDLCAIEEARAIRNLTDSFNLTHEQVAQVLGRSREAVSNLLRLLKLELSVQESVLDGQLSAGHARALVALPEAQQKQLAQQAMSLQWSVRALETAVRQLQQPSEDAVQSAISAPSVAPEFEQWREALSTKLGTAVRLTANAKGKGKIEIVFGDETALKQLIERLQS